jgi:polysaccharide export outer membrane protein
MHYARTPQTQALLVVFAGLLCLSANGQQPATAAGKEAKPADDKTIETRKAKAKAAQPAAAQREGYKIGSGDVLDILVWKEPDASIAGMVVRADGKVTIPFLKDIQVAGFTPADLEQKIKQDLSKYIQDAEVTVLIKSVVSEKVYVLGAVRRAGPLVMTAPITALQAIAEAGGPTDYAKKKKTYVLRGGQKIPFNYDAIIKGQNMEQNMLLLPGDTIVVP